MPVNALSASPLAAGSAAFGAATFNPPVVLGDYVLDFGLQAFPSKCKRIHVCSGPLTDYNSVAAASVGYKDFGSGAAFGGITNGSPSGRVVTSVAFNNGSITLTGTATTWAAVDDADQQLLAWGILAQNVQVTGGQLFALPSFIIHEYGWFSGASITVSFAASTLATQAASLGRPIERLSLAPATSLATAVDGFGTPALVPGNVLVAFSFQPVRANSLGTPALVPGGPFALSAATLASKAAVLGSPQLVPVSTSTVTHGQQISLANVGRVGAAAAAVAGYSGTQTIITGNNTYSTSQTFNNVNFTGIVTVTGGNLVFNFCTFSAHPPTGNTGPGAALQQYNGGNAAGTVTCNWCDFDSGDRGSVGNFETEGFNAGVRTGAFTTDVNSWFQMTRCSFQGYGNGVSLDLWCAGPSGFTECWFGNLTFGSGGNTEPSHVDCIECYSSTNITLLRCRMMGDPTMTTDYYTSTLINCTADWGNTPNDNPIIVRNCYTNGAAASALVVAWGANGSHKHGVQFFGNYFGDESFYGRIIDLEGSGTATGAINIAYDQTWWNANQLANLPGVILWAPDNVWAPNGEAVTNANLAQSGDQQAGLPHVPGAFITDANIYSGPVWIWTGQLLGPTTPNISNLTATSLASARATITSPALTVSVSTGTYPGQTGNPVGYAHAPGYVSLTAWPGGSFVAGTAGSPTVYSFYDFDQGTGGTVINVNNVKFVGCRFQSNVLQDANVQILSVGNITFDFCTISPRAALVSSIPNAAWPAAATGANVDINTSGCQAGECAYMIGGSSGYEYGIRMFPTGPVTIKNCDIWGFGNAIDLHPATGDPLVLIDNNWIHDAANPSAQGYHTDGPGYLEGGASPGNITISNNTIASLGNTNAIALQAATNGYRNITVSGNYFSGFGNCTDICHDAAGSTNISVHDNVWATDIQWTYVPLGMSSILFTAANPTNSWQRNKLKVRPGTVPSPPTSTFAYTTADDGKFLWADQTLSTIDWRSGSVPPATSLAVKAATIGSPTMNQTQKLTATSLASKASTPATPVFSGPTPPPPVGNYPGQSTNLVGHTHTPASPPAHWTGNGTWPGAYPGSVTAWTGGDASSSGTSTNYLIIAFRDFTNGLVITGSFIKFIGCRFQMNSVQSAGGQAECIGGSHHEFYYCSFVPLVSLHSQPPNGGGYTTWPTGGTGANLISDTPGSGNANPATKPYSIPYTEGYQYAIRCYDGGNILADHCDFWGWGNCIVTGSNNCSFTECWLHDARYGGDNGEDHSDGIGYIDSTSAPTFITIDHCTIVSFGLEDCIAMQGSTTGYHNWTISNCYLSGFDYVLFIMSTPTNVQVINNIVSGDIPWTFTPASASPVSWWAGRPNGNIWSNNKLQINAGDVDKADTASGYVHYTSSQNGYYIYPDATYHATDLV